MFRFLIKGPCRPINSNSQVLYRHLGTGQIINNKAAVATDPNQELKVGDIVHGYKIEKVDHIKELNIKPFYLRHQSTGAEHLHIQKEGDSNNVFSVSLRTTPKNSTGVAHILEHLALCGSKKYAVRDPFFKMTTRSLATFMNAMTGPDFTVYPFSTQNKKDFENMLSVYTDAVFFPRLRPVDFRQEGWRLEHENPEKKETPIILRGVVYNEMKGCFSSSSAIYGRQLLNHLFPDTTYKHESGGDPNYIPDLSYEELKKFHQLHYHPSNAKFFTYGDIPLENHLKLINELVMTKFSENPQARENSIVQDQVPWTQSRQVDITCPPDPMTANPRRQTTTSLSYLLPAKNIDHDAMFALQLLSTLLVDGPNAPFYKSLIESGLGSDYSPSTGLGSYTKQPYFSIGLQNIDTQDVVKVHKLIEDTLRDAASKGFPEERIEAVLHDIELGLKHIRGNFGLRLLMSLEPVWNHEGEVVDYFKVNKYMEKFKNDLKGNKDYWKDLIERCFLTNQHKLILTMKPDERFEEKRLEKERNLLANKISQLSEIDLKTVLYEGMELKKIQSTKDDPSILPCLEPSIDISRDLSYKTELKFENFRDVSLQLCEQPTNEVVYFKAKVNISERLPDELIDYLPLFTDVATKLGAGKYNRHQFALRSQSTTGGLGVSMMVNPSLFKFDEYKSEICIGSHCLKRNVSHMFELWTNVFKQIHFHDNHEYLAQLIKQSAAELSEGISNSGQVYAMKRSSSQMSNISSLDERLSGLSFVARMKDIASKEKVDEVAARLQAISDVALDPFSLECAINAERDAMAHTVDELKKFLQTTQDMRKTNENSASKSTKFVRDYETTDVEKMEFPFSVHYVAKALPAVPRMHEDFAKLVIMSKLISSKYLLPEVREKGGAYGAGAKITNSGILNFFSYRDPNTVRTIETFDRTSEWLAKGEGFAKQDIEESKLGVFQDVDRPVAPGQRGLNFFTLGETDEMRQEFRRRLLDVSLDDVVSVSRKYLKQKKAGTFILLIPYLDRARCLDQHCWPLLASTNPEDRSGRSNLTRRYCKFLL